MRVITKNSRYHTTFDSEMNFAVLSFQLRYCNLATSIGKPMDFCEKIIIPLPESWRPPSPAVKITAEYWQLGVDTTNAHWLKMGLDWEKLTSLLT